MREAESIKATPIRLIRRISLSLKQKILVRSAKSQLRQGISPEFASLIIVVWIFLMVPASTEKCFQKSLASIPLCTYYVFEKKEKKTTLNIEYLFDLNLFFSHIPRSLGSLGLGAF